MVLVSLGSDVINSTVVNNPQFLQLLPEGLGDVVSSAVDEGYLYGREWIASMVSLNQPELELIDTYVISI